jgi:hypothetical protein
VVYESAQHYLPGLQICAGLVFRWSESDDTCRILEAADFLLGLPEDGLACLAISKTKKQSVCSMTVRTTSGFSTASPGHVPAEICFAPRCRQA